MSFSNVPPSKNSCIRTLVLDPVCMPAQKSRFGSNTPFIAEPVTKDFDTEMARIEAIISEYKQAIQASVAQMEAGFRKVGRRVKAYEKAEQKAGTQLQKVVTLNTLAMMNEKATPKIKPPPPGMYM